MTSMLPEGWTIDEEDNGLPPGWKVESAPSTPKERDEAKLKKEAGVYAVPEKSPEELKKMTVREKLAYLDDLEREREYLQSSQFVKSGLSGLTFGLSENVEALKPLEFEEFNPFSLYSSGGQITGSLVPLTGLMKLISRPVLKLASKSPIFQKQISSLVTMFGVGSASKGLEKLAQGEIPSVEDVLEHGTEWAALDAILQTTGTMGRFVKGLLFRSKATGNSRLDIINKINKELSKSGVDISNAEAVSAKALEILEGPLTEEELAQVKLPRPKEDVVEEQREQITPKDLKTRKITDNRLSKEDIALSEPYQPEKIDFTKEAETLEKDAIQNKIDSVGTRAASEEELGHAIREDIETNLESQKNQYRPLYKKAEEIAENTFHIPKNVGKEAGEKLKKISRLKTKPEGYNAVIRHFENALEDAGYVIQRNEAGEIEQIISGKEVPVSDTIELARRLNEIVDYEAVEPSVKDALKSVARAAKEDIRIGLKSNEEGLAAFELAEEAHANTAKKFSKDSMLKIRKQEAGEKVSKMSEAPSTLGDLREVLSPQQMLQLEREMLEKLNNQNFEKAKKQLKEIERHLSAENKKIAREIVESKNPHNPLARKKITQDAILNDMSNAFNNGTRPDKTLALWKTPKGQKLIKETFHNSPNWPTVKSYLEKQSFNDMVASVMKDGKFDRKKFKSFMRDPANVNNIRAQGGEEAVAFFRNMDSQVKQFEENIKLLEKFPSKEQIEKGNKFVKESPGQRRLEEMVKKDFPIQTKVKKWREWFTETMGLNEKGLLSVFGLMKLGLPNTVVSLIGYRFLNKLLTSERLRRAFAEAAKRQSNPLKFINAMEKVGDEMDKENI